MLLGPHQLQILVSLVVILCAAAAALICDFLKRNNDELRELTIELKIRHEEELRRLQQKTPHVLELAPKIEHVAAPARKEKKRAVNSEALAAMERGAALAGSGKRPTSAHAAPVESKAEPPLAPAGVASAALADVKKDWESLLSRSAQAAKTPKLAILTLVGEDLSAAVVDATNSSAPAQADEPSLPAGFQDGFVLTKLVQNR
jgi:hypothetical protein